MINDAVDTFHFSTPRLPRPGGQALEMIDRPFDSAQGASDPERGSTALSNSISSYRFMFAQ